MRRLTLSWLQVRRGLAAIFGAAFACVVSVGALDTYWSKVVATVGAEQSRVVMVALLLLAAVPIVLHSPRLVRQTASWAVRPPRAQDVFLLALGLGLLTASKWASMLIQSERIDWLPVTKALGSIVSALLVARSIGRARKRSSSRAPQPADDNDLLHRVIGPRGMEPLLDLDEEDALDRKPFVEMLEDTITRQREHPLALGINGIWGSGKTTILNALDKRLRAANAIVVQFDAWSFREPERVVGNYMTRLGAALRRVGVPRGQMAVVRRLALGLAPIAGGRPGDVVRMMLTEDPSTSARKELEDLRRTLREQEKLIVVIGDDLDRLDADELHAALRAFRLFGDLPRVVHVLAYDRQQIARILFPNDQTGQLSRDYLGKIIHLELTLSTPTPEAATRILGPALQPLLDVAGREETEQFVRRLDSLPRQVFVDAMPTPRDVRRAAGSTALLWPRLHRDVNLFDLFVLQMIHGRFPRTYASVHAHREWFTEQEWSGDLWRISEGERWKTEAAAFAKTLWESADAEDVTVARLLSLIFPMMRYKGSGDWLNEESARRERRVFHPDVFPRYFQLSVPREQIAESSVEDLADKVREAQPATRVAVLQSALDRAVQGNQLDAFFGQWDIFLTRLAKGRDSVPPEIARDVAVAIAQRASKLPGEYHDPFSLIHVAAYRILAIALRVPDNKQLTDLLCAVIRESTSYGLSGFIVGKVATGDDRPHEFEDRAVDHQLIQGEFDLSVSRLLQKDPAYIWELTDEDIAQIIYRTARPHLAGDIIQQGLTARGDVLPRVLRFAVTISVDGAGNTLVLQDGLEYLHKRLDLMRLHRVTERLPLEYWKAGQERGLVQHFRKRLTDIVQPGGG